MRAAAGVTLFARHLVQLPQERRWQRHAETADGFFLHATGKTVTKSLAESTRPPVVSCFGRDGALRRPRPQRERNDSGGYAGRGHSSAMALPLHFGAYPPGPGGSM